jgi:hypothetical protein
MPEMTKEDVNAFIAQWGKEFADWMIESEPYYSRHPVRLKREVTGGRRGVAAGIAWAENNRSFYTIQLVLNYYGFSATYHPRDPDPYKLMMSWVGDDDEEFEAFVDQLGTPYHWGWLAGVRAVFDRSMEK